MENDENDDGCFEGWDSETMEMANGGAATAHIAFADVSALNLGVRPSPGLTKILGCRGSKGTRKALKWTSGLRLLALSEDSFLAAGAELPRPDMQPVLVVHSATVTVTLTGPQ